MAAAVGRVQEVVVERRPRPAVRLPWAREPRLGRRRALARLRDLRLVREPLRDLRPVREPQHGPEPAQRAPDHLLAN